MKIDGPLCPIIHARISVPSIPEKVWHHGAREGLDTIVDTNTCNKTHLDVLHVNVYQLFEYRVHVDQLRPRYLKQESHN